MQEPARSSVLLLLDEINRNNNNVIAETDVIFGAPTVTTEHGRNTRVHVNSTLGSNYSDDQWVWYNRLDIVEVFRHLDKVRVDILAEGNITYLDVLHSLNTKYNLKIADDEILPTEIVANRMILKLAPGSLAFTGEVNIILSMDGDIPLYETLINVTLDGLWYPNAIVQHMVRPELVLDGSLLSIGVDTNGRLKYGDEHHSNHMVIATNNELEVAVRAGVIGELPTAPIGGELILEVNAGQKVEFVFSIVLLDDSISNKIDELYDISFYLNCKDTPATFIATMAKSFNGTFHFIADDRTTEVRDLRQFNSGRVIQTVQSIENFPSILDGGIPGVYEIGLVAYRRNSIVPRLEAVANFTVIATGL